jgi:hydroxyethylthiazole kinase-like uncharacterized protein yjeF
MTRPAGAGGSRQTVTRALLRRLPLPALDDAGDKESRGRVLVIGGSVQVPGAVLLAGVGALRAGAGKLQLATARAAAVPLALAVPEAMVVALPTARDGELAGARAAAPLREHATKAQAVLVGPGMAAGRPTYALVAALVPRLGDDATLVLDGAAVVALRHGAGLLAPLQGRAVLTPHAGEMASLLEVDKREIDADPPAAARRAAERFGAVVALKGAESWIATPDGALHHYRDGVVGLGTSGSGDTLAGIVVGLAARGADALTAAVWGVWAHGSAGALLARRTARVGFLARELLAEVPALVGGG